MSETGSSAKEAKADAKAAKARAKAMRPWYRKKRVILPLALIVVIIIAVAAGSGSKKSNDTSGSSKAASSDSGASNASLYPNRPDRQEKDHEAALGGSVELVGYTATVKSAAFKQKLNVIEEKGYLVADVTILNRNKGSQPYNEFDFKLQTSNGQVIDPTISADQSLGSGALVSGGNASGQVVWEIGTRKGDFFIIYKPKTFDSSRGIWKATV